MSKSDYIELEGVVKEKLPNNMGEFRTPLGIPETTKEGNDVTIVTYGSTWRIVTEAAKQLEEFGISAEVINIHTIKPLDEKIILKSVSKTKCIVSAEEHNYLGGLGESISRVLSKNMPLPQEFVATKDTFGESGTPAQLMKKYGLNSDSIVEKVKKVINRK